MVILEALFSFEFWRAKEAAAVSPRSKQNKECVKMNHPTARFCDKKLIIIYCDEEEYRGIKFEAHCMANSNKKLFFKRAEHLLAFFQ